MECQSGVKKRVSETRISITTDSENVPEEGMMILMKDLKITPTQLLKKTLSQQTFKEINIFPENNEENTKFSIQDEQETFHKAVGSILKTAQIFGLMPVKGILATSPDQLRFQYLSLRIFYTCIFIGCFIFITILSLKNTLMDIEELGHKFLANFRNTIVGALFYGNALGATILFLKLGYNWPDLMAKWHYVEQILWRLPFPRLSKRFSIITAAVMISALCEHILSILGNIPEYTSDQPQEALDLNPPCPNDNFRPNVTKLQSSEVFKVYSCHSHHFIFTSISYNMYFGIFLFVAARFATFIWNFADLFIVLISIGLAERFIQFNQRIKELKNQVSGNKEWQELREHYNMLSNLVKVIDKQISGIVLLSFANNLIFICVQLSVFIRSETTVEKLYFFGSFAFLLGRAIVVNMSAARIHEESKAPLQEIFNISSSKYCTEMVRLQNQITTDEIALTGMGIFTVTRSFLLVVAGCIFTYGVVLLQFYISLDTMG